MRSRFSHLSIALWCVASAAVLGFLGCEWGGAHDNTWNDGYSWANFTGTYRFVNAVLYVSATEEDSESKRLKSVMGFAKETSFPVYNGQVNVQMTSATKASGVLPNVNGVLVDSVSIKVSTKGGVISLASDSGGTLHGDKGAEGEVTSGGTWSINLPTAANAKTGNPVAITYKYYGKAGGGGSSDDSSSDDSSSGGGSSGGGSGSGGSSGSGGGASYPLSFLKVTQQGNKLTMTGDNGVVYKGQLTGASTSKDGYVAAQQVRLSFEVSSASGLKITGHFSGVWSGASDKLYGVLSERTIQGTHSRAGNFVGAAADTTIRVSDLEINEAGKDSVVGAEE